MKQTSLRATLLFATLAFADKRRRRLGMQPISVYAKSLAEMYRMPLDESSIPPAARPRK
jgi:hypothetical protein